MSKLKEEELLKVLDEWIQDEWNMKGGMARALALKGKKEKAGEIVKEIHLREQAYQQIKETIQQKAEVTEEWIEERTDELFHHTDELFKWERLKGFIRSLVEEMPAKKLTVNEGFVEKWGYKFPACTRLDLSTNLKLIKQMLKEAGVKVVK